MRQTLRQRPTPPRGLPNAEALAGPDFQETLGEHTKPLNHSSTIAMGHGFQPQLTARHHRHWLGTIVNHWPGTIANHWPGTIANHSIGTISHHWFVTLVTYWLDTTANHTPGTIAPHWLGTIVNRWLCVSPKTSVVQ